MNIPTKTTAFLLAISFLGGVVISGVAFIVMGNAFGFENISLPNLVPGFLVGAISAYVIAYLFHRSRQHFLARLKAEQEVSKRLAGQITIIEENKTLETWLGAIFENSPIEIALKDKEGKIIAVSQSVAKQFGLDRHDFVGRTTADFLAGPIAEKYIAADRHVIETGNFSQQEILEDDNGVKRYSLSTKLPVCDSDGQIIGICSITSDITDLKMVDEERRIALEEAEKANRAKSEFLATMSHELRTPLNAIRGFSEMLTRQIFGPLGDKKYLEYSYDIQVSSEHLLNLINDLLDLSSIEAGKKHLSMEEISLREIIEDCSKNITTTAKQKDIMFSVDIQDSSSSVVADRRALTQILINLLNNAVKFTPDGGQVSLQVKNNNGASLFEVRDTGRGIPADMLPKIGEPFYRANSSYLIAKEGTGLGLTIVKSLVELHDGSLEIKSDIGIGTTVTVKLPNNLAS